MRKKLIGISIILLYCFPYAYFSMKLDLTIMIIPAILIPFFGSFFINPIFPLIIGNILSAMVSLHFINKVWGGRFDFHFYPLQPIPLLRAESVYILIPQFFAVVLARLLKKFLK